MGAKKRAEVAVGRSIDRTKNPEKGERPDKKDGY